MQNKHPNSLCRYYFNEVGRKGKGISVIDYQFNKINMLKCHRSIVKSCQTDRRALDTLQSWQEKPLAKSN
ncbi:hypothetical protein EBX93_10285 [bacterium]|nr:hypothetical protein [bacterium]